MRRKLVKKPKGDFEEAKKVGSRYPMKEILVYLSLSRSKEQEYASIFPNGAREHAFLEISKNSIF